MISARGLLAIGVGIFFLFIAIDPLGWVDETPPWPIQLILYAVAAGMLVIGVLSLRFVWNRYHLLRFARPVAADICILPSTDSDDTMFTMHVRVHGQVWQIGIVINGNSKPFADGVVRTGKAWLDPKSKMPLAVAVDGRQMNTLPVPSRIKAGAFAVPERT